jgi:hypothetical protein
MAKPRMCPHCKSILPLDHGFYFDDKLNLVCGVCDKVVVEVEEPTYSSSTTSTGGTYSQGMYTPHAHGYTGHQGAVQGTGSYPSGRQAVASEE